MVEKAEVDNTNAVDKTKSARSLTYIIFGLVLLIWIYSLWADRMTPMTDQARVNGQVIRITPQVSGPIAAVNIIDNQVVTRDQSLLNIDKQPFELAVKAARFQLQQAGQTFKADTASIDVAKANEVAAQVKVTNTEQHLKRNQELLKRGMISKAAVDDSLADVQSAKANLVQAQSALDKAKQQFGPRGENNPEIQAALNKLEQALLDLNHTDIQAPNDGIITNLNVAIGDYASASQPLLTFVNNDHFWLTAMVRENSLGHLKQDIPVKIVLDAYPGQVFTGKVTSIGWGSSGNDSLQEDSGKGLLDSPTSSPKSQRFPVNIEFTDLPKDVELRYSGRAVIAFYPGMSSIGELLLDAWIKIWSYLSYVS